MLEAVGHPVRHLHRSTYAGLTLDGLEPGEWRELTPDEVASLVRVFGRGNLDDRGGGESR
jgi:16S rRNA U516 pseudouridylate synthase RsuA-like enzyme